MNGATMDEWKRLLAVFGAACFILFPVNGQTPTQFYNARDYRSLAKLEANSDELSGDELYMIGFAFFQLENDVKAIEFYDKAISKGLNNGAVHFYKGLALRFMKKYEEALAEIEKALALEPTSQEYKNEKGMVYYYQQDMDKAYVIFQEAKKLPGKFPEPFYWVARIHHERGEFEMALKAYYEALDTLPKTNSLYKTTLVCIGQLEYTFSKEMLRSATAYAEAISLDPKDYALYPKLIKAYNAGMQYARADSVFALMKAAFERKELSEEEMKFKNAAIDEYEWNGQKMVVHKYFVDPKEPLDVMYKVYLLSKDGGKIERTFMTELTIQIGDGAKHLLCEKGKSTGVHYTYPYGWNSDEIPLEDLRRAVGLVLEGKMKYGASSELGR